MSNLDGAVTLEQARQRLVFLDDWVGVHYDTPYHRAALFSSRSMRSC